MINQLLSSPAYDESTIIPDILDAELYLCGADMCKIIREIEIVNNTKCNDLALPIRFLVRERNGTKVERAYMIQHSRKLIQHHMSSPYCLKVRQFSYNDEKMIIFVEKERTIIEKSESYDHLKKSLWNKKLYKQYFLVLFGVYSYQSDDIEILKAIYVKSLFIFFYNIFILYLNVLN